MINRFDHGKAHADPRSLALSEEICTALGLVDDHPRHPIGPGIRSR